MKKALIPILAVIAVAAIVLCFVFNGQKADLEKSTKNLFTQETVDTKVNEAVEAAKSEFETVKGELEGKVADLEAKVAGMFDQEAVDAKVTEAVDAAKAEFETVKGELESKAADLEAKAGGMFDQEAVNAKVTEAVDAAKAEFETVKGELEGKVADLEAKAGGMFDQEAVDAKVTEAVDAAKAEFETVKGELEGKAADLEAKVEGMFDQKAVDAKVTEAVDAAKAEFETVKGELEAKVAELEGKVAKLEAAAAAPAADEAAPAVEEPAPVEKAPAADEVAPTVEEPAPAEAKVLSYDEFMAAEIDSEVTVEAYVQDHESWWADKISVHAQDDNGGYYFYEMACSEEDAAKLVPGTKIRVTGYKAQWPEGNGLIELASGCTFEFVDAEPVIYPAEDVTALIGTDELVTKMSKFVVMKDLVVVPSTLNGEEVAFLYNWDGSGADGDDLYFNVKSGDTVVSLTVRRYLRPAGSDVYEAVKNLKVGDTIDAEGFLYWYTDAQPHITDIVVK